MKRNQRLNAEGYADPTAYHGILKAEKQREAEREIERYTKHNKVPRVYIVSPYAGDVEANVANAKRYCRFALKRGYNPIASHLYYTQFLNDSSKAERQTGLNLGLDLMRSCSEVWWFGEAISNGMYAELCRAKAWHIPTRHFDTELNVIE
ncbi:hypothetical protein FACS1894133_4480 [Clostridia bacterium]|nr:hypothetical protein FACS1894133_4480 [Clostridia bacterium]